MQSTDAPPEKKPLHLATPWDVVHSTLGSFGAKIEANKVSADKVDQGLAKLEKTVDRLDRNARSLTYVVVISIALQVLSFIALLIALLVLR